MSFDTIRINELAKELGLSSKEVLDKLAKISITGKTHSSTITPDQIKRLKEFISQGSKIVVKKPKAFVVKKAKVTEEQSEETSSAIEIQEKPKHEPPKVEVVRPKQPVNRLEIVRRANPHQERVNEERKPFRSNSDRKFPPKEGAVRDGRNSRNEKQDRGEKPFRPFDKRSNGTAPKKEFSDKKPINSFNYDNQRNELCR